MPTPSGRLMSFHLPFHDHVHRLDAAENDAGATEILETHHGSDAAFDGPVVLLHYVVQILVLTNLDRFLTFGVERMQRGQIRPTLIDRHGLRLVVLADRLFEVASGRRLVAKQPTDR